MGRRLWLARSTYGEMSELANQSFPLETGGMLLGYEADGGDIVVKSIIGPGPKARHRRYRFRPDAEYQQAELTTHHLRTRGQETYLGDWHTHPQGIPELSWIDKRTLAKIARTPSSGIANPLMAILGGDVNEWEFFAVRFIGWKRRILFNRYDIEILSLNLYE